MALVKLSYKSSMSMNMAWQDNKAAVSKPLNAHHDEMVRELAFLFATRPPHVLN